ncbi:hypothetical protein V6N12_060879 [Hibiscus sabdariffa]|uniref:Uncharacterized protein n=1 Tax=Hibiscus sabdariffa TaxID=183260 RepID=A0ABR1ZH05_9ROSI
MIRTLRVEALVAVTVHLVQARHQPQPVGGYNYALNRFNAVASGRNVFPPFAEWGNTNATVSGAYMGSGSGTNWGSSAIGRSFICSTAAEHAC